MTTTVPREPDERIHLQQGQVLLQDQILGYIAYRGALSHSYVDQSRDMDMTDGWVGDIANARIKVMKLETREKVSLALSRKYGAEGIPVLHSKPVVVPAPKPVEALHRGFGAKGGDPSRPLAPPIPIGATYDGPVPCETKLPDGLDCECTTVEELEANHTPSELAASFDNLRQNRDEVVDSLNKFKQLLVAAETRVTEMDNTRIRLGAEIVQRDRTIKGQAEDMDQYEKTMEILQQRCDDLQGFKDGVTTQLRQFAVLLWQVVPPEMWPQVPAGPYKTVGVETGRFSSAFDNPANRPRIDEEMGPFGEFATGRLPSDGSDPHAKRDALDMG